ncbi:MAG: ribokinase [Neolewinella sp.]|jgi:ribokinase
MKSIIVIGSSNTDMVVKTERFPKPGETIVGGEFFLFAGGKGANQAVAAARLGGKVQFVARVGDDLFGRQAVDGFLAEGIDCSAVKTDPDHASGTALITVDASGENSIVVAPGANNALVPEDLDGIDFAAAGLVLMQLETPLPTIAAAVKAAPGKCVLNPAPAQTLPPDILNGLYLITPNETEAELLTGVLPTDPASCVRAAKILHDAGVQHVIITLGAAGAFYSGGTSSFSVSAPVVKTIDTTAAGDCFNGAVVVALAEGKGWREAIEFAVKAASISVTRMGAQVSVPKRSEL